MEIIDFVGNYRKESLDSIERRFQFVIILGLFLPFVLDKLGKIYPSLWIGSNITLESFFGFVILHILLGYFFLDVSRREIGLRTLDFVSSILGTLVYSLIITISFPLITSLPLSGWKDILLNFCILGDIIFPFLIATLVTIGFVILRVKEVKEWWLNFRNK